MTTRELSIATLFSILGAGGIYTLDKLGAPQRVVLATDTTGKVELLTANKDVLLAEATSAGARSTIACKLGVVSNYPGRCYCTDGETAGWLTDATACEAKIEVIDGKVYVEGTPEIGRDR